MMKYLFLHTADTNRTARFHKLDVSQQELMELLVADLVDVKIAKTSEGDFIDIAEWSILKFDDDQNIVSIVMDDRSMGMELFDSDDEDESRFIKSECFRSHGTINFAYVPVTTRNLEITWLSYKGTLDTSDLPDAMIHLVVKGNALYGSFDIAGLPRKIEKVVLSSNEFSGSLHMESLPPSVTKFDVTYNEFCGTVNLNALPNALTLLSLKNNNFGGALSLLNLPKKLYIVYLSGNGFDTDRLVVDDSIRFFIFSVSKEFEGKIERPDGTPCTPSGLRWVTP